MVPLTGQADSLLLQRAVANPATASPADILALQRAYGNRAVTGLIQAKLTVGPVGDVYEQEADRVAEQVVRGGQRAGPQTPPRGSKQEGMQRQGEEEEVQTKPLAVPITPLVQREAAPEEEELQLAHVVQPTDATAQGVVQRAKGPSAAHEIKDEDIEYEIIGHRLAYQDAIPASAKQWLDSRGYEREWARRVTGLGFAVGLLLPKQGSPLKRRAVLAFKGTTPSKTSDVLADLDPVAVGFTAFKLHQAQVGELMQIGSAASSANGAGNQVDVIGHSLGGALAQHAASAFPGNVKRVVTFQAPGISAIQAGMFKGTKDVTHHIAAGDIVDLAGGKHLPGNVFMHDVSGLGTTHMKYLLNSEAFKNRRDALGLTEAVLASMGVAGKRAKHTGHVSKTQGYPFFLRQAAVEGARTLASPLAALALGGKEATMGLVSGAKKAWGAGVSGAKSAWKWGGKLAKGAWQGTRGWGRDELGQSKSGVGNWFKRQAGNVLGGLGVAGARVLGGLGAAGSGLLGGLGAAGAGTGALVTGAGTLASGLGAAAMGLGGAAIGGAIGVGKWLGAGLLSGAKKGVMGLGRMGRAAGRGLSQLVGFLNPFKRKSKDDRLESQA